MARLGVPSRATASHSSRSVVSRVEAKLLGSCSKRWRAEEELCRRTSLAMIAGTLFHDSRRSSVAEMIAEFFHPSRFPSICATFSAHRVGGLCPGLPLEGVAAFVELPAL